MEYLLNTECRPKPALLVNHQYPTMSLTPDTEPFSQAHDRVWKNLTEKERNDLSKIFTIDDVWKAAAEIQARQVSGSLGNMNKICPYVDGMKRYAGVIGTMVQAKPEILSSSG
jgi:hypothetical protein